MAVEISGPERIMVLPHIVDCGEYIRNAYLHGTAVSTVSACGATDKILVEHGFGHFADSFFLFIRKRNEILKCI